MKDVTGDRTADPPGPGAEWAPEGPRRAALAVLSLIPQPRQVEQDDLLAAVRRNIGGSRQITVVNPCRGAGKTVAALMLGLTFGEARGGSVLAWDNSGAGGLGRRVASGEEAFDVLASDDAAGLTAASFRAVREVVARRYRLLIVDTGDNVRAGNWLAALDSTDQMVVTVSARSDSADSADRLLDHLDRTGRRTHVRRAVVVLTMPARSTHVDANAIEARFGRRCRAVLRVPYDRHLHTGAVVTSSAITPASQRAWLRVTAAVAHGL